MQRTLAIAFAFHALAAALPAQDEAALRSYFEGRTVVVKVAMPATEAGIDVYPGAAQPVDYPELAKRMKKHGIAIQAGQSALVTKLKVKGTRLQGGSRFNLRYRDGVPPAALSAEAVTAALADYVDFEAGRAPQAAPAPPEPAPPAEPQEGPLALRKGMSVEETDRLLGAPTRTRDRKEGTLSVSARTYDTASGRVVAEFVEGVLVRFTITSR